MLGRMLGLIVSVALVLGAQPAEAAPHRAGSLKSHPSSAIAGEAVRLTGRLPAGDRELVLELKARSDWLSVDAGRSDPRGRFAFDVKARTSATTYRVKTAP